MRDDIIADDPYDLSDEEVLSLLKDRITNKSMWSLPEGWTGIVAWFGRTLLDMYYDVNILDGLQIFQVKQKFHGLRFYYAFMSDVVTDDDELGAKMSKTVESLVRTMEAISDITCEYCGNTRDVTVRTKGWSTRRSCHDCYLKM